MVYEISLQSAYRSSGNQGERADRRDMQSELRWHTIGQYESGSCSPIGFNAAQYFDIQVTKLSKQYVNNFYIHRKITVTYYFIKQLLL